MAPHSPSPAQQLPIPQFLAYPSIDPLAEKNRRMSLREVQKILDALGAPADKPLLLQVSRFDRFKDPIGVINAYRMVKRYHDVRLMLAGGGAADDPEGAQGPKLSRLPRQPGLSALVADGADSDRAVTGVWQQHRRLEGMWSQVNLTSRAGKSYTGPSRHQTRIGSSRGVEKPEGPRISARAPVGGELACRLRPHRVASREQ